MSMMMIECFGSSTVRMAIPILIAALGLTYSERSGIMNIGGEGVMLMGAFAAFSTAMITGSYWAGLVAAMLIGMLTILLFAFTSITLRVQQVVVGAGLNMLCAGLTSFVYRIFFRGENAITTRITTDSFPNIAIPGLSDIPILGSMFFDHNIIVYFGFLMVFVQWFILYKTSLGIKIIAVGENPRAADSLGIKVLRMRYLVTVFSGFMLGIAGAYLSIAQANNFTEGMTGGRGFIALAVVVLGKWNPLGAFFGAMLFGAASALQLLIQNQGWSISSHLVMSVPYIMTVIAVIAVSKNRVGAPGKLAIPYVKS